MSAETVDDLQRLLLGILKGNLRREQAQRDYDRINGFPPNVRNTAQVDVADIRRRIHALNPNAALYECWGGTWPEEVPRYMPSWQRNPIGSRA